MVNIEIKIFNLHISFNVSKTPKNAEESLKHDTYEETPIYEDNPTEYLFDENKIAQIANQFQAELKSSQIYDIPDYSDIPPRYNISDDVEIITDSFEKEVEDIMEGRR